MADDRRKQLAQRLYPNTTRNRRIIVRDSSLQKLDHGKHLPMIPKLTPLPQSTTNLKKHKKLEPLSSYITAKLSSPLPSTILPSQHLEQFSRESSISKMLHADKASLQILTTRAPKRKHMHGDMLFQTSEQISREFKDRKPTPFDFIQVIKSDPELQDDFWYCNRKGDAYDFEFVPFRKKDNNEYLTISSRGVTHFQSGEAVFLTLAEWEREYRLYQQLKEIRFFKQYKMWKNFSLWKNMRRRNMMVDKAQFLEQELFILDEKLRDPLLNIRDKSFRITVFELVDINLDHIKTLEQFNKDQERQREKVADDLEMLETEMKSLVAASCKESMEAFRKDNNTTVQDEEGAKTEDESDPFLIGDSSNKQMPYTQEAIIRTHYKRLAKFIRLCDYLIIDSKIYLSHIATNKIVKAITHDYSAKGKKIMAGSRRQHQPLLTIFADFDNLDIDFDPNSQAIKVALDDALMRGLTMLLNNYLLINAPDFERFTKAVEEFEEKQYEEEIDLLHMVISDSHVQNVEFQIREGIEKAFVQVVEYAKTLQPMLELYRENVNMDIEAWKEQDNDSINMAIDQYLLQEEQFKKLESLINIGIFQLNTSNIKNKLVPSPKQCLDQIFKMLPQVTYERCFELLQELNIANDSIKSAPVDVESYVNHQNALKDVDEKLIVFTNRFTEIKGAMELMEIRKIPFPDRNKYRYNDTLSSLNMLRQRIANSFERAESDKIKFARELREKVNSVTKRVNDLKQVLSDPRIADRESKTSDMIELLGSIGHDVHNLYEDCQNFNYYQDQMETEKKRFDDVEDLKDDYTLKYEMWNAIHEWSYKIIKWNDTIFSEINVEQISKEVENYYKIAQRSRQLEEQQNFVPQLLLAKVEALRDTMPVVADLRSKHLKAHHWEKIREEIEYDIDIEDPEFLLRTLIAMKVNDKKDKIGEIALSAKKEEDIEDQLNKAVSSWENVSFQFKRDADRDYYTFTEIEDIQTQLEDTQVVINTLLMNRFAANLIDKIDYWNKQFSLFAETLEEWLTCQKQWVELEKIFSSGDIAKQMADKAKKFNQINEQFKALMNETSDKPDALIACTKPGRLKELQDWNKRLEKLQKDLEEYLDKKRKIFPRFFFLANDELLEILSNSGKPAEVATHLKNMFENIYKLQFEEQRPENITSMISAEGETVMLPPNTKARGNVEEWLSQLEEAMVKALKEEMKNGFNEFQNQARREWVLEPPSQIVATVGMLMWCFGTEDALRTAEPDAMQEWFETNLQQLDELTQLVREDLDFIKRRCIVALVTQDVHNRDIVETLRDEEITSLHDFRWQQQLRYYWNQDKYEVFIYQVNSYFDYTYEFMGATTRLVITPLTDRCWMTITGALHIKLGAAPAGPAGTGKTESTKDLAKALGIYCVVFNCSEQVTHQMTEKLFMGLCYTGSWTCLDEFNRIDIEVLSVIASQLRQIKNAKQQNKNEFQLDEKNCKLVMTMGVFITMNPSYAGRTELPDNLKVLFRPVSMMVPDYTLIAEIMLFAEGFSEAKVLSGKMTKLYKLCSEQLSQQDHYDFGMRAVKSVLNMAGVLKRKEPHLTEDVILLRAMRDSNVPKFLKEDLLLFDAIVQDLFPGLEIPPVDMGDLAMAVDECIVENKLQPIPSFVHKVIQLYETFTVRFGVMIVGPPGTGKTKCYQILAESLTNLRQRHNSRNKNYQKVIMQILNPKAITMGELYGEYNELTLDWKDGLASDIIREYARMEELTERWVVFDGPVDSLWIENMNSVLDDSRLLCLGNSERIKVKPEQRMLFEVMDLSQASPATVSRCGMVYMHEEAVGWWPYIETWFAVELEEWPQTAREYLRHLFGIYLEKAIYNIRRKLVEAIPTINLNLVQSLCKLIKSLTQGSRRFNDQPEHVKKFLDKVFVFCTTWSLGGALDGGHWFKYDSLMTGELELELPTKSLYDSFIDFEKPGGAYKNWKDNIEDFIYDPKASFHELLVPTKDTFRFSYLLRNNVFSQTHTFVTGGTGVGKSMVISSTLNQMKENDNIMPIMLTFSAQTNSLQTQNSIIAKLDQKSKVLFGGPGTSKVALLIDDINMPAVERYGAQPPIELMRQFCDVGYFYERSKHYRQRIIDTTLIACAAPPEGGRNPLTPRFSRHFHMLCMPPINDENIVDIFKPIMDGFLKLGFNNDVVQLSGNLVQATNAVFQTISAELLPTPSKSHYTFNLRDVSKVFQGILMVRPKGVPNIDSMIRLWRHEVSRVFHDRLINEEDKRWFNELIVKMLAQFFRKNMTYDELFEGSPILFADFVRGNREMSQREYEEFENINDVLRQVNRFLKDYNDSNQIQMNLVFFLDAIEHLCRICRILRQQRGNAMLIGVGGCGKQSLTKLATFMCHSKIFTIYVTKDYKFQNFRDDLKVLFMAAGGPEAMPVVFLLNDTQIIQESFLEDVNNILNSGEVPNLFTKEEYEQIDQEMRPVAEQAGVYSNIFSFFIQRVRENLHVVLCMSPVGAALRTRMRMFPSLVNCCTIDWVKPWPEDALFSVAQNKLANLQLEDMTPDQQKQVINKLSQLCVTTHVSVEKAADEFYQVLSRKVYLTPKSYLDMIQSFLKILETKKLELSNNRSRYKIGVDQLLKTNQDVIEMEANLKEMAPVLEVKKVESEQLAKKVEADSVEANKVKEVAEKEEYQVNLKTQEIQKLQAEAEEELNQAMPILERALRALDNINSKDIAEIRTFGSPPALVVYTLECIAILMEAKPDWDSIKRLLQNNFIDNLKNFPKDSIKTQTLRKLRQKIKDNPEFTPEIVGTKNLASKSLCEWVYAIENYAKVAKEVEPKKQHLLAMNETLNEAQNDLAKTQAVLKRELDKVAALEAQLKAVVDETERLDDEIRLTGIRLERASVLTEGLKEERQRWEVQVEVLTNQIRNILGDVFVASASISYYGPFTGLYRNKLVEQWLQKCAEFQIPVSPKYDLQEVMGDQLVIRDWNIASLPTDDVSVNNGILVTKCDRWPLMIDPQEQANRWIRKMEEKKQIKLSKQTDKDFARSLELCIRNGIPMLVEDVGEVLNPVLDPVLLKNLVEQSPGYYILRMGEQDVDYDVNFRLYMTSKMGNPHYLPDVFIKVSIINFTVTTQGLEEQLLGDVVNIEEPNIEKQKIAILQTLAQYQKKLKETEDKILKSLTESKGNILDDAKLIENLKSSKKVSEEIGQRMISSEETKKQIEEARSKYKDVAVRGSILYFVIADLALIGSMYQFSLTYFTRLFNNIIRNTPPSPDLPTRLDNLLRQITEIVYINVCRGLFNEHKLIFSFLIAVQILRHEGKISESEWSVLLRGVTILPTTFKKLRNPNPAAFNEKAWEMVTFLQNTSSPFMQPLLGEAMRDDIRQWISWIQSKEPHLEPLPHSYRDISAFHKLLLVKCFREEKVIYSITNFVESYLGRKFVEAKPTSMEEVYIETNCRVPIIFILSVGADPMGMIQRLAEDKNFQDKMDVISLGKGQGEKARKNIDRAKVAGEWVVLQNCHLAKSWMPDLEKIVDSFEDHKFRIHEDFRLFLTSTPCDYFPIPVLQNGLKITNEPPKGIKSNVERSLFSITPAYFEESAKPEVWQKLLLSLCFFHAIVQERRKFGPLGWNIKYEFNDSDLETSTTVLKGFLETDEIPWDSIKFVTGEINYGGRVTDDLDRRCLNAILNNYINPQCLEEGYTFSSSGIYRIPDQCSLEVYKDYVMQLPLTDDPEIFGMHENANISFQRQESDSIVKTVLSIQPRESGAGSTGKSNDEIIDEMAESMLEKMPTELKRTEAGERTFLVDSKGLEDAMATFLGQEMERFNVLLKVMHKTLAELRRAIKGLVVMSADLDAMYIAMLNNQVPALWSDVGYASLKPLSSWFNDLKDRVDFLRS